ncbi:hypothetical protein OGAPHI_001029 [Ogataea philodendri]|uniref:RRN6 beta-propeller domain-containing protein n=1 Tax=Ogataea philodendri TaxID=1378263 RepID=A0A9P8PFX5_9ASCO|nr:uncharacterized protein OGAPHI_001029 [Ogataea philodendri]KAH3670514.1 hypothetical protein OGAPHI_001029 [Ogataea philodendri]
MWPGNHVHLAYGVDGTCVYRRQDDTFDFPKRREPRSRQWHTVRSSFEVLVPAQLAPEPAALPARHVKSALQNTDTSADSYFVPRSLVRTGHQESLAAQDSHIYDPTYGDLLAVLPYSAPKLAAKLLISATGHYGTLVAVSVLDTSPEPALSATKALEFSSRVKQVFVLPNTHLFGVRTSTGISVFEARLESRFHVGVARLVEIPDKSLAGQAFADVCVCPQTGSFLGAVDVKGNFGLYRLLKRDLDRVFNDFKLVYSSSIFDPAELSNFKKIVFGQQSDTLVVLSRSSAHMWTPASQNCKVVANHWTRLLDLAVPCNQTQYCVLLTTKEVLLVSLATFDVVLGWSHLLDQTDPTLRLYVRQNDDRLECHVVSQTTPMVYVIVFQLDERPHIAGDPYFYVSHPSQPVQSLAFTGRGDDLFGIQLTRDLELSRVRMQRASGPVEVPQPRTETVTEKAPEIDVSLLEKTASDPDLENVLGSRISALVAQFQNDSSSATDLSSLLPVSGPAPDNLSELVHDSWSVYESSARVFSDQGKLETTTQLSGTLMNLLKPLDFTSRGLLGILQKQDPQIQSINTNLGLSLVSLHKASTDDQHIHEIRKQLPLELAALLDQWRPHAPLARGSISHTQPGSQVPTISVSQARKKPRARSSRAGVPRPRVQLSQAVEPSSQVVFSSSQASEPSSQPPSGNLFSSQPLSQGTSSQKKRKKRKMGGFM